MPALLYELAVALNELLIESGFLAGIIRYTCTTAFAWFALLVASLTGLTQYLTTAVANLVFGTLTLVWPYAPAWYGYINAVLPVYEMMNELVTVSAGYGIVIGMRWVKSVIPTESN